MPSPPASLPAPSFESRLANRAGDEARQLFDAAVGAAAPGRLLGRLDWDALFGRPLAEYGAVRVVGAGKAAIGMAAALERALAERGRAPSEGSAVVVPHGYRAALRAGASLPDHAEVIEAGHPVPDAAGLAAAGRALAVAAACGADDLLVVLVSGGGSSLWAAYADGITVADARATAALLLRSGATIHEMNAVRKHLSRVGGGRLAAAAYPAAVLGVVISDVVGDDLSAIASGPTVADPTTFADAVAAVERYGVWDALPEAVRHHLAAGARAPALETEKPGSTRLARARTVLAGGNSDALAGARDAATALGYDARVAVGPLDGEARGAGVRVARAALAAARGRTPTCLLWGGETTVTVRGAGRGGRNQELALAAALELERGAAAGDVGGADVVVLSGGTDGVDGPTDAAGGWVTPGTAARARALGVDPAARLADNDSHSALDAVGALLRPGVTHTNVMDVQVALVRPRAE